MKKAFVTIFPLFSDALAYKDVGLISRYMSVYHGYDGFIISNKLVTLSDNVFERVENIPLGTDKETGNISLDIANYDVIKIIKFISKLSKTYDKVVLNFYHLHRNTILLSSIIKMIFPKSFIYIKLDIRSNVAKEIFTKSNKYKGRIRDYLLGQVDMFSAETHEAYHFLKQVACVADRTYLIPNGVFLDDGLIEINKHENIDKKEKIIFTAGRLESYEKNTRLLVDAYFTSRLWLEGWQLILAGSYDEELVNYIRERTYEHIGKDNKMISLTGHLNREQLFAYMRKAKIFALSSRWEGFALVLPEAVAHGCIIAATDVGGVADVTNMGTLGFIAKEQTVESFADVLKSAAESDPSLGKKQMDFGISNFDWKSISDKLAKIIDEKTN